MLFLDEGELDLLYPCRLLLSQDGTIEAAGPSIRRLLGRDPVGDRFDTWFRIQCRGRSTRGVLAEATMRNPVTVTTLDGEPLTLRGAAMTNDRGWRHLLLAGAPDGNVASADRFRYADFAPTDSAIDLLMTMQVRDASIEDARRLSERLMEARAAEAANQAKTHFLASMSHELRTPLNAIIGFTEIVIEDLAQAGLENSTDDLARVLRAATHLLGLVNDVLDLAKIEAGKMTVRPEPLDFAELARETATSLAPLIQKNRNRLVFDIAPDVGAGVSDVRRVRQCLINLVGNAAKFTADGEIRLGAVMERGEAGPMVAFTVEDTGIGMTAEQLERLFRPFVQASRETATTFGGTGLGLAITSESARLMGGSVDVRSTPGVGSAFVLRIPAHATVATCADELAS